jgi:hypothetical protein
MLAEESNWLSGTSPKDYGDFRLKPFVFSPIFKMNAVLESRSLSAQDTWITAPKIAPRML